MLSGYFGFFKIFRNVAEAIGRMLEADDDQGGSRTEGGSRTAPTTHRKPLGQLIGAFKTISTKHINIIRNTPGIRLWQRNYYEHVIRDESDLAHIREYIINNPLSWIKDEYYTTI